MASRAKKTGRTRKKPQMVSRLAPYWKKRSFKITPEPEGKAERAGSSQHPPLYVIQKHDATALHYDFRLEAEGVLKSWAVPKGPSMDPLVKRLAMQTEDHPLEYARFEGIIPENQYGAGPVIVWDLGFYENQTHDKSRPLTLEEGIERGHIRFKLNGQKLHGVFALTRVGADRRSWLLVKMKEASSSGKKDPVKALPRSVLSGKTIAEMAQKPEAVWQSRKKSSGRKTAPSHRKAA